MNDNVFAIGKSNNIRIDTEVYYVGSFLNFHKGNSVVKIKFLEKDLLALSGYLLKAYYAGLKRFKTSDLSCMRLPGIKFKYCEAIIGLENLDYCAKIQFRSADMLFELDLPIAKLPSLCQIVLESIREYEAYEGANAL